MSKIKQLKSCNHLKNLEAAELVWVASIADFDVLEQGSTLFSQGEAGNELFLLLDGAVELQSNLNSQQTMTTVQAGTALAEMAALTNSIHMTTARVTSERALVAKLDRQKITQMMQVRPQIAFKIFSAIGHSITEKMNSVIKSMHP